MCNVNKIHRTAIHSLSSKHINTSKYIQQNQDFSTSSIQSHNSTATTTKTTTTTTAHR